MTWWKHSVRPALTVAALAAVCHAGTTNPMPAAAPAPSSYEDRTYHFAINGPEFVADPAATSVSVLNIRGPARQGFADNMNVVVQPKSTRAAYAALNRRQFDALHMTLVAEQNKQVGGHDAVQVEYAGTLGGKEMHFLSLAIFGDEHTCLATCTAPADRFEAERPGFQRCLDSFRLTAP